VTKPAESFERPEARMPAFAPGAAERRLLRAVEECIRSGRADGGQIDALFAASSFPQQWQRLILILYAPGAKRILVSRESGADGASYADVLDRLLRHERRAALAGGAFRLQMDFVVEPPIAMDFYQVGTQIQGERHFEPGVDGFMYRGADGKLSLFPPGDAYVRSAMGMGQIRDMLHRQHGEDYVRQAGFWRIRTESYLSAPDNWLRLYRGYPLVGAISRQKIEHAVDLAIDHIRRMQQDDGRFLYYYDAALDTRRDHEHPTRHPDRNPFYNILRHGGGGLTCLFGEKYRHSGASFDTVRRAIEFYIAHLREYECHGRSAAYVYSEKKAKLGGSGIALYLLAEYQIMSGDRRYQAWADRIAWHLAHQITASGEFIYYHVYLDKFVAESENHNYFSFYYPGEAVCGLAKYLHLVDAAARDEYFERLHRALDFLIRIRPQTRADQYTAVPSDSWLMMGIMELWDFPAMQRAAYADFVFGDAAKMIAHLYRVSDAPYPDYAGAFYYEYGDYPYADGARCEGLLGAYELALKMGDRARAAEIWPALKLAAWAVMHLVNTEDAIYFARNPALSLGGIRFKYTRQWFRIDTIQHVASFFAKMLPYWEREEGGAGP